MVIPSETNRSYSTASVASGGQIDAVEKALEQEQDCSKILMTIAACRGAIHSLMAEVIEGHIRYHVIDPDRQPTSEKAKAAQELIDVVKAYLK